MTALRSLLVSLMLLALCAHHAWASAGEGCGACNAPEPSCAQTSTTGTNECGQSCNKLVSQWCDAAEPLCGQTTSGNWTCGNACTKTGPDCGWQPYGFVMPGDPAYGFPDLKDLSGTKPLYPDPKTTDMLGLAAQGNIVIGDYTDKKNADGTDNTNDFPGRVIPRLRPQPGSPLQPYVIDPADAALGYHDAGFDAKGRPKFSGDYTQVDELGNGQKLDGTPRRFYESTLPDAEFKKLIDPYLYYRLDPSEMNIDAVLFTNHTITGFVNTRVLNINGTMIARDDTLTFLETMFNINHDVRLFDDSAKGLELPFSLVSPKLLRWEECPPAACPP